MEPVIPDGATVAVDTGNKRVIDGELYAINGRSEAHQATLSQTRRKNSNQKH